MHTQTYETEAQNHRSRPRRFGRGYLDEGWFMGYDGAGACDLGKKKKKTVRQVAHWVEEKQQQYSILLLLENNFY